MYEDTIRGTRYEQERPYPGRFCSCSALLPLATVESRNQHPPGRPKTETQTPPTVHIWPQAAPQGPSTVQSSDSGQGAAVRSVRISEDDFGGGTVGDDLVGEEGMVFWRWSSTGKETCCACGKARKGEKEGKKRRIAGGGGQNAGWDCVQGYQGLGAGPPHL